MRRTILRGSVATIALICFGAIPAWAEKYVMDISSAPADSLFHFMTDEKSNVISMDLTPAEAAEIAADGILIEKVIEYKVLGEVVEAPKGHDGEVRPANSQWAAVAMETEKAHKLSSSTGVGQRICLLDTGIDKNHSMLRGKLASVTTQVPGSDTVDRLGHGTHVASLMVGPSSIGANAPGAKIISIKVLSDKGAGESDWIAKGIDECVTRGAHIINMSLGAKSPSLVMQAAIRRARDAGVIVVAASGNDSANSMSYPAAFPEVTSVGATTSTGQIASFSNRGSGLGFVAPGSQIVGAKVGGGTVYMSGTSMASPFVAGLMALKNTRKSKGIMTKSLGYPARAQGRGLVNSLETANNR